MPHQGEDATNDMDFKFNFIFIIVMYLIVMRYILITLILIIGTLGFASQSFASSGRPACGAGQVSVNNPNYQGHLGAGSGSRWICVASSHCLNPSNGTACPSTRNVSSAGGIGSTSTGGATYGTNSGGGSYTSGTGGVIGELLCDVVGWFTGSIGQGIATLSIIVLGIGALMGKVSWGAALTTGVGVATIFGAPDLVYELTDQFYCE